MAVRLPSFSFIYPLFLLLLLLVSPIEAYKLRQLVPLSRRGQLRGGKGGWERTGWVEELIHACPRFGKEERVELAVRPPKDYSGGKIEGYKLNLAFDHGRWHTGWLPIVGGGAPRSPEIVVDFEHEKGEIRGVHARLQDAGEDAGTEKKKVEARELPKLIYLRYQWTERKREHGYLGLGVVYSACLLASAALLWRNLQEEGDLEFYREAANALIDDEFRQQTAMKGE